MPRFALALEYCGQHYTGWQKQPGLSTIQTHLETALSTIADERIGVQCAGRTDAGVHATYQIVHFDTDKIREMHAWMLGTNAYLPPDIRVQWVMPVSDDFHARFSATARRYRYFLQTARVPSAIWHGRVSWHRTMLDVEKMREAAQCLLGEHDFTSFRSSDCQAKHAVRTMRHFHIEKQGDLIVFEVCANAFLHHMVRNLVGSLINVGSGEKPVLWMAELLAARDRKQAGMTMSPDGLYLVDVEYPAVFELPASSHRDRIL